MRLIKLGTAEFPDSSCVHRYFQTELQRRMPPGLFLFKDRIAEGTLTPGETVLFCYEGSILYVAEVMVGREVNSYLMTREYPHCFTLDVHSIKQCNIPLHELEAQLQQGAGLTKSLRGQAWVKIGNDESAEVVVRKLLRVQ